MKNIPTANRIDEDKQVAVIYLVFWKDFNNVPYEINNFNHMLFGITLQMSNSLTEWRIGINRSFSGWNAKKHNPVQH